MPIKNTPDSLAKRNSPLLSASVIAAHAKAVGRNFRQKDVSFLLRLFSNWLEHSLASSYIDIQNNQLARHLDKLVGEGFCRCSRRGKFPQYRLTRVGLLELLGNIAESGELINFEQFLFLHYFICCYAPRIRRLIVDEGSNFPTSLRHEVEIFLDHRAMIDRKCADIEKKIAILSEKINSNQSSEDLANQLYLKGVKSKEIVSNIEKEYPYGLNSEKPLSHFLEDVPPQVIRWELSVGLRRRNMHIWEPSLEILMHQVETLQRLRESTEDSEYPEIGD